MGRLLRTLGLSPQRPLWRAWQADPDAVQRWQTADFPAIRAQAKADRDSDVGGMQRAQVAGEREELGALAGGDVAVELVAG